MFILKIGMYYADERFLPSLESEKVICNEQQ